MKKVLINILKKYKILYLEMLVILFFYEIARYIPTKMVGQIIDVLGSNIANNNLIIKKFTILFFSSIIYCFGRTGYSYLVKTHADNIHRDLENAVFEKFLNLKVENIDKIKNGELMSYILRYTKRNYRYN